MAIEEERLQQHHIAELNAVIKGMNMGLKDIKIHRDPSIESVIR